MSHFNAIIRLLFIQLVSCVLGFMYQWDFIPHMHQKDYKEALHLLSILTNKSEFELPHPINKDKIDHALKRLFGLAEVNNLVTFIETESRKQPTLSVHQDLYRSLHPSFDCLLSSISTNKGESKQVVKRGKKPQNRNIHVMSPNFIRPVHYSHYTVIGHIASITCVVFAGAFFITAAEDCVLKIWETSTGMLQRTLLRHNAPINDACVSFDRQFLVSCDSIGMICIWNLVSGEPVVLDVYSSVEFVEFVSGTHLIICVLRTGSVKTFNVAGGLKEENNIMTELGDIRAICISEAGKFLLCGGMWPFVLLFDTSGLTDRVFTFDTDGYSIIGLCASTNKPRFCASTSFNFLFEWEFTPFGKGPSNIYRSRTRDKNGYWTRRTLFLSDDETIHAYRLTYMVNDTVVTACSDNKIRIISFHNIEITFTEVGVLAAHSTLPLFATSGIFTDHFKNTGSEFVHNKASKENIKDQVQPENLKRKTKIEKIQVLEPEFNGGEPEDPNLNHVLRFYDIDGKCISEHPLQYRLTDAFFSSNGNFLVLGNEMGGVYVLSVLPKPTMHSFIPREQFFFIDLCFLFNFNFDGEDLEQCYDVNGNMNANWKRGGLADYHHYYHCTNGCSLRFIEPMSRFLNYSSESAESYDQYCEKCFRLLRDLECDMYRITMHRVNEEMAMSHISSQFYTIKRFKHKYLVEDNKVTEDEPLTDNYNVESISEETTQSSVNEESRNRGREKSRNRGREKNKRSKKSKKNKKNKKNIVRNDPNRMRQAALDVRSMRMSGIDEASFESVEIPKRRKIVEGDEEIRTKAKGAFPPRRKASQARSMMDSDEEIYNNDEDLNPLRCRRASQTRFMMDSDSGSDVNTDTVFPPRRRASQARVLIDSGSCPDTDDIMAFPPRRRASQARFMMDSDSCPETDDIKAFPPRRKASQARVLIDSGSDVNTGTVFPPRRKASLVKCLVKSNDEESTDSQHHSKRRSK